jgi:hypothetical protein
MPKIEFTEKMVAILGVPASAEYTAAEAEALKTQIENFAPTGASNLIASQKFVAKKALERVLAALGRPVEKKPPKPRAQQSDRGPKALEDLLGYPDKPAAPSGLDDLLGDEPRLPPPTPGTTRAGSLGDLLGDEGEVVVRSRRDAGPALDAKCPTCRAKAGEPCVAWDYKNEVPTHVDKGGGALHDVYHEARVKKTRS